jgi:F-type H+-transporting ATPase subunit b
MLDIYPLLIVITTIIFFVMLYLLNKKLYQPLLKFMDDRDAAIAKDMAAARNMSGNSDELASKAKANIDAAKVTAAKLRQDVMEDGKSKMIEAIEAKQKHLEKQQEKFAVKLDEERVTLQNSLLSQIPLVKESLKAKFSQL